MEVSHEFLQVLGVPAVIGRGFLADEDRPGGPNDVVMITEDFWRTRFGADSGILGQRLVLDDVPRTVIGVLPRNAWIFPDRHVLRPGGAHAGYVARRALTALGGRLRAPLAARHDSRPPMPN